MQRACREINRVIEETAKSYGWVVRFGTGSKHPMAELTHSSTGRKVKFFYSGTPSDGRSFKNFLSNFKNKLKAIK